MYLNIVWTYLKIQVNNKWFGSESWIANYMYPVSLLKKQDRKRCGKTVDWPHNLKQGHDGI